MKTDYSVCLEQEDEFLAQSEHWNGADNMALVHQIAERIPEGATVLDAGAGSGAAIPAWLERASAVVAVDACERALLHIMYEYPTASVVKADLRQLSSAVKPVDVVVCKATLKHFSEGEWRHILRQLFTVARQRVIFTMGVAPKPLDRNPGVSYYDRAEPVDAILDAIPEGWAVSEMFGGPLEPVFVCDRARDAAPGHSLFPWQVDSAPEHVRVRQPVMELKGPRGPRLDLPPRRAAIELPTSLHDVSFGIAVMSHRGCSNGRLSVLLSSIPANFSVIVSSDSIAMEDVEGDREVCAHHGVDFSHSHPWGGRAKNAIHTMACSNWRITMFLNDDCWLFPEAVINALRWFCTLEREGVPLAALVVPGWETYREHVKWGFASWQQCLDEPWRFEAIPPNPNFYRCPALYKNVFGTCMVINRDAYNDLGGFTPHYWAEDDVFNHQVWASGRWVNAGFPGRGYMHLGAQSWHHGEAEEYVGSFRAATGMTVEESGRLQVEAIERWRQKLGPIFARLGGTDAV